jgi:Flp pilus assembly protein TadG
MTLFRFTAALSNEDGAVLSLFAIAITALVLFVAFVVDAANWYEHKRHLQLQADAAALAGAQSFTLGSCSNANIAADARRYGGSDSPDGSAVRTQLYNDQVGGTPATKVHILINSSGYYGDTGAGDNTDTNGAPCAAGYIDIKATESSLPWFFGGALVPKINAHARVSLVQESEAEGTLPIAVPNPLPRSAAAIFINEDDGSVLGTTPLNDVGQSGSLEMYSTPAGAQASVSVKTHTGVVIALSGRPSLSLTGSLATICSQSLTDCYDASSDPPAIGLSYIRGWSSDPPGTVPAPPQLRDVQLFSGSCARNGYFTDSAGCTADIEARIDAGDRAKAAMIIKANGSQLYSDDGSVECDQLAGGDPCWHGTVNVPASAGAVRVTMTWEVTSGQVLVGGKLQDCKTGGGNKCKDDFEGGSTIQRAYAAKDTTSGPIKLVNVFNCGSGPSCASPTTDPQSHPVNLSQNLAVSIGIAGTLRNATSTSDPLVVLRIKSNTGQSLDCDPGYTNLKTELAQGCRPSYVPNTGSPDCTNLGTSALWATSQPWSCIAVNTGRSPNDVGEGLNLRILLDDKARTCPAVGQNGHNNWAMFNPTYVPTGVVDPTWGVIRGQDGFPIGDRRILNAYLTTYGAFSHVSGTSGSVPVTGFGHFYVTGWTGNGMGFSNPCQGNGDDPVPNNDSGLIVGHFIRYVDTTGGFGTDPCDPSSIDACVIVMTK